MKGSRPLTNAEITAATESFQGRYATRNRALFVLGINTGLRISEMLSVRLADALDPDGSVSSWLRVARRNMKNRFEGRTVRVNTTAREALAAWITEMTDHRNCTPETFLFQSQARGNRAISISMAWLVLNDVYRRLGFPGKLGTHAARKTYAATVKRLALARRERGELDEDVIRVVSRALGHRDIATTEAYLSFDDRLVMSINDEMARPEA